MRKMSTTIDRLHDALVDVEKDGKKILNEKFMMNIFKPFESPAPQQVYEINLWGQEQSNHQQRGIKQ